MLDPLAGTGGAGSTGKPGLQLVAVSVPDREPSKVWMLIVGAVAKPEVASIAVTEIVIGVPPRVGLGDAATAKMGDVVSIRKARVAEPVLPERSVALTAIVASPSGPPA